MSSINAISAFAGSPELNGTARGGFRQTILASAAQALGLSADDLQSAPTGGKSLADVAQERGVSRQDLVAAVATGVQGLAPNGVAGTSDAATFAGRVVDRHGYGGRHHNHGPHTGAATGGNGSPFAKVSDALGMSQSDLLSALESGESLPDLLNRQGLTLQSLDPAAAQGLALDETA